MKIFEIVKKDFKILIRSKLSALIILLGPLIIVSLIGMAFNNSSVNNIKIGTYQFFSCPESFFSFLSKFARIFCS